MPYINVRIGKAISENEKNILVKSIADHMPMIPGKTVDNTMIEISEDREMYMSGSRAEIIFVDMRVFRTVSNEIKDAFVVKLSAEFEHILGIPVDRQYFNIQELSGWGFKGHFLT